MNIKQISVYSLFLVMFLTVGFWIGTSYNNKRIDASGFLNTTVDREVIFVKEKLLLLKMLDKNQNDRLRDFFVTTINSSIFSLDAYKEMGDTEAINIKINDALSRVAQYYNQHPEYYDETSPLMPTVKKALNKALQSQAIK